MESTENANKDLLHLTILIASPLGYGQDALPEVLKCVIWRKVYEVSVNFFSLWLCCPLHKVVFEDPFMELVKEVGCNAAEDVHMGEV